MKIEMNFIIKPTKIKTSFYLLIPKIIAELINVNDNMEFELEIKNGRKKTIQYVQKDKAKAFVRRIIKRRTVKQLRRKKK